jgi:hypothetical protein
MILKPGRRVGVTYVVASRPRLCGLRPIYDIFEGTAEIQHLVISRAISGMYIK